MKIRVKTKTMNQERKRNTLNPGREAQNDHIDYARDFNQREIKPSKKIHTHNQSINNKAFLQSSSSSSSPSVFFSLC